MENTLHKYHTQTKGKDRHKKHVLQYICDLCGACKSKRSYIISHLRKEHPQNPKSSIIDYEQISQMNNDNGQISEEAPAMVDALNPRQQEQNLRQMYRGLKNQFNELKDFIHQSVGVEALKGLELLKIAATCAHQVITAVKEAIIVQLTAKLQILYRQAAKSGIDVRQYASQTKLGIIDKISSLNLSGSFSIYGEQLKQHWKTLQEELKKKNVVDRTFNRYIAGFTFWKKYSNVSTYNMPAIISDINQLSNNRFRSVFQFYQTMIANTHLFPHLPQLPNYLKKRRTYIKRQFTKIRVEDVQQHVRELYLAGKNSMAADLWLMTTLGLRKSQLLQVRLVDNSGKFCRAIEIFQRKNKRFTVRVIVEDLKKLVMLTKTPYPITAQRYSSLRSYCISCFHRFYSLRSTCLTTIMSQLFEATSLARFHCGIRTTMKNYIDTSNLRLINAAFRLNIDDLRMISVQTSQTKLKIDQKGSVTTQPIFQNQLSIPILDPEYEAIEQQDAAMLPEEDLLLQNLTSNEESILRVRQRIFQTMKIQTNERAYDDPIQAIDYYLGDEDFTKIVQKQSLSGSQLISTTESIYNVNIQSICIGKEGEIDQVKSQGLPEADRNEVALIRFPIENKSAFLISIPDFPIRCNPSRKREYLVRSSKEKMVNLSEINWHFVWIVTCKTCSNIIEENKLCKKAQINHYFFTCSQCGIDYEHVCPAPEILTIKPRPSITVNKKSSMVLNFKSIPLMTKTNNLRKVIEATGRIVTSQYECIESIPSDISTTKDFLCEEDSYIIMHNRMNERYLPLTIRKTADPRFGYGVFALAEIEANSVILSYLGSIVMLSSIDADSQAADSLYTLGYLTNANQINEIIINPARICNAGRFINCSRKFVNARPVKLMYNKNSGTDRESCIQFGLVLIANKKIAKGEQILYNYDENNKYWEHDSQMIEPDPQNRYIQISQDSEDVNFNAQIQIRPQKTKQRELYPKVKLETWYKTLNKSSEDDQQEDDEDQKNYRKSKKIFK